MVAFLMEILYIVGCGFAVGVWVYWSLGYLSRGRRTPGGRP